jgi:DNA-binding LytR/AlgR family response regulator
MRVLVADDEAPARRMLARLLDQLGGHELVGEAASGLEALELVGRTRPDVLLLDIDMPELGGLELAARYAHLPPVVFVTAHDAHAVRAFELDAVDYLLKPVRLERLAAALQRVAQRTGVATPSFAALPVGDTPRVVTHERGEIRVFDVGTIDRFRAAEKYTVFLAQGHEHMTEEPLVALEGRLRSYGFLRVHRSELVRVAAIRALTGDALAHELVLADGQRVRVARRFLAVVKHALGI